MVVYIRRAVRDRLRESAGPDSGRTQTDQVLAAIDATHAQLADHFRPDQAEGSLFAVRAGRRRLRRDEPQAQVSFRPWAEDLEVIDRLVEQLGAPSRSVFIDTALDMYLPR